MKYLLIGLAFFLLGIWYSSSELKKEVEECYELMQDRCTGLMTYASDLELENAKLNKKIKRILSEKKE